jgi:hypothetical protein
MHSNLDESSISFYGLREYMVYCSSTIAIYFRYFFSPVITLWHEILLCLPNPLLLAASNFLFGEANPLCSLSCTSKNRNGSQGSLLLVRNQCQLFVSSEKKKIKSLLLALRTLPGRDTVPGCGMQKVTETRISLQLATIKITLASLSWN